MIEELIESAVVVECLESTDKNSALREIVQAMIAADAVAEQAADEIGRKVSAREAKGSTGIGHGIAVPHVKLADAPGLVLALARSQAGLDYQAIDGQPVHTIFFIVANEDRTEDHLAALRWVSTLARNADFRRFVLSAPGEAQIRDLLREMSAPA